MANFSDSFTGHAQATPSPSTELEAEQHHDLHVLSGSNAGSNAGRDTAPGLSTGLPSAFKHVGAPSGHEFDSAGGAGDIWPHTSPGLICCKLTVGLY